MRLRASMVLALCVASFWQSSAVAAFLVLSGNNPQPGQENVNMNSGDVGMTVVGTTNNTSTPVAFTSASQQLIAPSNGQARIEATTLPDQVAIDDAITISLPTTGQLLHSVVFNAFLGGGLGAGGPLTLTVNGVDAFNNPENATFTMDAGGDPLSIGNGANFFAVVATAGSRITSLEISPNAGTSYADLRQVRLRIVPEPTALTCAVLGLISIALVRRRIG